MDLVTVGTGTVAPSAARTAPCHWVTRGDLRVLLDCGAGSLHRLAEFRLPWQHVTHVVVTHFHPDHWGELPMLIYSLKYTTEPPRKEPIRSPRGIPLAVAARDPRGRDALSSRPLGRAADAHLRPEVHDRAAAQGADRHPRSSRHGPARPDARRRLRRLAPRSRLSDRHSRRARRRAVSTERGRQPRDVPRAAHDGERRGLAGRAGRPSRLYRRYRPESGAGALGRGLRPLTGGVLAAG